MAYFLNYYNDALAPLSAVTLPASKRMIYTWRGSSSVAGHAMREGGATFTEGEVKIEAGSEGAMLFRWDLRHVETEDFPKEELPIGSMLRMSRHVWSLALTQGSEWLFRLDVINNPAGAVADVHTHQGPGIRALLSGSFKCRQPSEDGAADCPGDPWWESGIEAVISTPHETEVSKFLRCMILPLSLKGSGNSGTWHRNTLTPPPDWTIWSLLVDEPIRL